MGGLAGTIHGGNTYGSRTKTDGLNTDFTGQATAGGQLLNTAGASEVVINTSGGLGEAEGAGVNLNIVPKDGGNTFRGSVFGNTAKSWMQGSNFTQSLKDQGLRTPAKLNNLYDVDGQVGGRIVRDKLWFYVTVRKVVSNNTVPGMWVNKNANNPNSCGRWTSTFRSRPLPTRWTGAKPARLTWQASQRHKLTGYWQEQHNYIGKEGGGTPTQTPEAHRLDQLHRVPASSRPPGRLRSTTSCWRRRGSGPSWASTTRVAVADRASAGSAASTTRLMIQQLEQTGTIIPSCNCSIPGLISRHPGLANGGFSQNDIGTHEWRASLSYVSGAHNMKFGYQGGFSTPTKNYYYDSTVIQVRTNNGVAESNHAEPRLPRLASYRPPRHPRQLLRAGSVDAKRLTLQGGVRFDNGITNYTSDPIGGLPDYPLMPTQVSFPTGSTQGIDWKDITPRAGVAYDLFGNGKTAVKASIGKYMEGLSSLFGLDMNPIFRIPTHDDPAVAESHQFQFHQQPGLRSQEPRGAARLRADGQSNLRDAGLQHQLRPQHGHRLGKPPLRLVDGDVGAAGAPVRCGVERRLLPQLVGQPVDGGQHAHEPRPTTRRSASPPRSIRGCRAAEDRLSAASSI